MEYLPLIVIGAPRSGTNMLRNVLTSLPGMATWPCDEINYIWRHGNVRYHSDEFMPEMARSGVRQYIRRQFDWVSQRFRAHTVVEKTCANSLRVDFVDRVMPEAKYIFIRRDGLDALGSAIKRWKAEMDIPYLARKARFVPLKDLPYYAFRYFRNRLHRFRSREDRLAYWGPRLDGMPDLLASHPLDEICAIQWKRCVDSAAEAFDRMNRMRWIEVAYEDFVRHSEMELGRIMDFLGLNVESTSLKKAVSGVQSSSIGRGRTSMSDESLHRIKPLIIGTMCRHGYL